MTLDRCDCIACLMRRCNEQLASALAAAQGEVARLCAENARLAAEHDPYPGQCDPESED